MKLSSVRVQLFLMELSDSNCIPQYFAVGTKLVLEKAVPQVSPPHPTPPPSPYWRLCYIGKNVMHTEIWKTLCFCNTFHTTVSKSAILHAQCQNSNRVEQSNSSSKPKAATSNQRLPERQNLPTSLTVSKELNVLHSVNQYGYMRAKKAQDVNQNFPMDSSGCHPWLNAATHQASKDYAGHNVRFQTPLPFQILAVYAIFTSFFPQFFSLIVTFQKYSFFSVFHCILNNRSSSFSLLFQTTHLLVFRATHWTKAMLKPSICCKSQTLAIQCNTTVIVVLSPPWKEKVVFKTEVILGNGLQKRKVVLKPVLNWVKCLFAEHTLDSLMN